MQKKMSYKRSNAPTKEQIHQGWTSEMKSINETFKRHKLLLLLLAKLNVMPTRYASILCKDFERNIWAKIRDGE